MAQSATAWSAKIWNPYAYKHRVAKTANWADVVPSTKSRDYAARYYSEITDQEQELLEFNCIAPENLLVEKGQVRAYYMNSGRMIGASDGFETMYIYVEHRKEGDFHGRPITMDQLRKKGAKL